MRGYEWITAAEAAQLLNIGRRHILKMIERHQFRGRLVPVAGRAGKRWEVDRASLPAKGEGQGAKGEGRGAKVEGHEEAMLPGARMGLWEAATAAERALAEQRLAIVHAGRAARARRRSAQDKEECLRACLAAQADAGPRVSRASWYRWDRRERTHGITGLLPRFRGGVTSQISPWAALRFKQLYLDTRHPSVRACYDLLTHEAAARGDILPGYSAFQRYASQIPHNARILGREGYQAYQQRCDPPIQRDYTAYAVNEEWHCDHAQCDYFVVDARGRRMRPWKTEWMDLRSRRVVGSLVYAGPPTSETVLASFRLAALRFGLPERAVMDNGLEMAAYCFSGGSRWRGKRLALDEARMRSTLGLLGVAVCFTTPENPRSRGALERKFRTDQDRFDRTLPTYCGNRPEARPADLPDRLDRMPTLPEAQALYHTYIEADHHERPHRGQGMDGRAPRVVYESEITRKVTATEVELIFCCFKTTRPATIGKAGVRLFDRWYQWDGYGLLLGKKVYARYDPEALGTVWLFDERDVAIGPATCDLLLRKDARETDWRRVKGMKKRERQLAREAMGLRADHALEPDPWRRALEDKPAPPPDRPPKIIAPVQTPLRAEAKKAAQQSKDRKVAESGLQDTGHDRERQAAEFLRLVGADQIDVATWQPGTPRPRYD